MRLPNIFNADKVNTWEARVEIKAAWTCARPHGLSGLYLVDRVKRAWLVFSGQCDVLKWRDQ